VASIGEKKMTNRRFFGRLSATVLLGAFAVNAGAADDWKLVQAYLDLDEAWHAKDVEIQNSDVSAEEKQRLRTEERGEHPDIVLAVAAARSIVASDGRKATEAATFLVEHTQGLSPTADADIEFGMAALAERLGPDWSIVEDYMDQGGGLLGRLFGKQRTAVEAVAAANAIVELGGEHDHTVDAAEFLIERSYMARGGGVATVVKGLNILADNPNYENWPRMLMSLDRVGRDPNGEIEAFVDQLAASADDPVVRATARYYAAARLASLIDAASEADRASLRERALALAEGLSTGVEDEEFVAKIRSEDGETAQSLSHAESDLLATIRYATVGGQVSELKGRRLDGSEETLEAYGDQIVLVDFWATWCGPCIAALPKLRDLATELPADEFEILSISIDQELDSVTDFQVDEPMPWAQWHVGAASELTRTWRVRGIPTYVILDREGRILAKGHQLDDDFLAVLHEALGAGAAEDVVPLADEATVDA